MTAVLDCPETGLAMCGKDLTGVPDVDPETGPDPVCAACEAAWLAGFPCPAPECPRGER